MQTAFPNRNLALTLAALLPCSLAALTLPGYAQDHDHDKSGQLSPNHLVVSRSVYDNKEKNVTVGTVLPPNCATTTGGCSASTGAPFDGSYPNVWNDAIYDASFGITSRIYLDQLSLFGKTINTLEIPNSDEKHSDSPVHLVTSFSSKSELALNLSTNGKALTFMGYVAPVNVIDVSNSNTPLVIDPSNPDGQTPYYRAIAEIDENGKLKITETNAYSGNNGRAAILNSANDLYYTAGNAGNGANPQPGGIVAGAGAQFVIPSLIKEDAQNPGLPTPVGSFNVTELGDKADKLGKDDNFRGLTIFKDVVYFTKGSGGNGVNTVYFIDTVGTACPNGTGIPVAGAKLPTAPLSYNILTVGTVGLANNMCILRGFPTLIAKSTTGVSFPFGLWFANANTLYVADEGDGSGGADLYTHAAAQTTAGLQKWVFNPTTKTWSMAYVLYHELALGVPYTVKGYPTGNNAFNDNLPWAPATDGLRNITGLVGPDDLVAIWGITSTVSGNGDQGADPNKLVVVLDKVSNTDPSFAATTPFFEVKDARFGEVLRGVSFTPGTDFDDFKTLRFDDWDRDRN